MFTLLLVPALFAATPAAVSAYAEARLYRSAFAVSGNGVTLTKDYDPASAPLPWGVFNGQGNLLSAEAFADTVNDAGMIARFRKEDRKAKSTNTVLTVLAIVAVSVGGAVDSDGAAAPSGEPSKDSPQQSAAWTALVAPWKSSMPAQLYHPVGCLDCRMTGYKGRVGIYEIMPMSTEIKKLVASGAELARLREQAMREGMKPLRIAGAKKVAAGLTTIAEIIKVAPPMTDAA